MRIYRSKITNQFSKTLGFSKTLMSGLLTFQEPHPPTCAKSSAMMHSIVLSIHSKDHAEGREVWCYHGSHTSDCKIPGSDLTLKQQWNSEFWGNQPDDILLIPLNENGSRARLFVPGSAMKNGETYTFETRAQSDAMVEKMIMNNCLPKCVWPIKEEAEAIIARLACGKDDQNLKIITRDIIDELTEGRTELFLDLCQQYSKIVERGDANGPFLITEIVRSKSGAGHRITTVNEGVEKYGIPKEFLTGHLGEPFFVECISESGRIKREARYELSIEKEKMEAFWSSEISRRNLMTNWFCSIDYFEHLPGIDINGMLELKRICQGKNGRWLSDMAYAENVRP